VLAVVGDLAADGQTMVIVTHEIGFARRIAFSSSKAAASSRAAIRSRFSIAREPQRRGGCWGWVERETVAVGLFCRRGRSGVQGKGPVPGLGRVNPSLLDFEQYCT